jgi:membrane associated rhomboid family serine protease
MDRIVEVSGLLNKYLYDNSTTTVEVGHQQKQGGSFLSEMPYQISVFQFSVSQTAKLFSKALRFWRAFSCHFLNKHAWSLGHNKFFFYQFYETVNSTVSRHTDTVNPDSEYNMMRKTYKFTFVTLTPNK